MPHHTLSFAGLHERLDEQNEILNSHTAILREIVSSQKEMTATLRRIEDKMCPHSQHDAAEDRQE